MEEPNDLENLFKGEDYNYDKEKAKVFLAKMCAGDFSIANNSKDENGVSPLDMWKDILPML